MWNNSASCGPRVAALTGVSRAGFYRRGVRSRSAPVELRDQVQRVALEWPAYGSRRITAEFRETARYRVKSGATKIALGHKRSARTAGMAECTPKALASYEAAQTTERRPRQATMTGLPRSCGSSRCSTEA